MKLALAASVIFVKLFTFAVSAGEPPQGEKAVPAASRFIDLDGDGLDDNIADGNKDGIPDFHQNAPSEEPLTLRGAVPDMFKGLQTSAPSTNLYLSKLERFNSLKFCSRALSQCRSGLGSGDNFGPGVGIGQSTSGGGCAGGICR
jgi:hypothetical protein